MDSKDFIASVNKDIIETNMEIYTNLFQRLVTKDINEIKDPNWRKAQTLFNSLTSEQRDILFSIMRNAMVATTSKFLGVLDGSNYFGQSEEFLLYEKNNSIPLNIDLQDLFLAEEELKTQK